MDKKEEFDWTPMIQDLQGLFVGLANADDIPDNGVVFIELDPGPQFEPRPHFVIKGE